MQSLEGQSLASDKFEIILVDNGKTTPSLRRYRNQPNVTILTFAANRGFAAGNNRALAHARGETIFLLNQDVVLHTRCLQNLLDAFYRIPAASFISANMLMVRLTDPIDLHGPQPGTTGIYQITRAGFAQYEIQPAGKRLMPTPFVSGNALCFKRSALRLVGNYLFDERLISYAEDLDLSLRAAANDLEMFVCPEAVIYHFRDDAFYGKPTDMIKKYLHVSSNRLLVYLNRLSMRGFLERLPLLIMGIPLKLGRRDNDNRVSWARVAAGSCLLPLSFVWFAIKAIRYHKDSPEQA